MLPVNTHFHLVIGIDIHIVLVPTPAGPVPTPLPHPFIGYIYSLMDYIPHLGAKTFINNVPRGNSGSNGKLGTEEHLPMPPGTKIVKPPANNSFNYFGSLTVKAEGSLLSPSGFMVMSCSDFGIPMTLSTPPGNRKFFPPVPSLYTPLSATIPIPLGAPVLVGGPYVPDLMGMLKMLLFSYGFSAALKGLGTLVNNLIFKKFDCTEGLSDALCQKGMDPVDLVTGRVIYKITDFELPGPLPVKWERSWYSDSGYEGILGHGTHLCYDLTLVTDYHDGMIGLLLPDGRATAFPLLINQNEHFYNRPEKLTLTCRGKHYELKDHKKQLTYVFKQIAKDTYKPETLTNANGFSNTFNYNDSGKLISLTDSVGRTVFLTYDVKQRIIEVVAKYKGQQRKLVQYGYNENNDLSQITDALGKTTSIRYQHHLMVERTDRNGHTFYWEYDGSGRKAKCVHSRGDNGLLEGWMQYHKGYNEYTNSLGETTTYYYNDLNLNTRITDPLGNSKDYEYTEFMEIYREIDEEGNVTGYTYDNRGNLTSTQLPDTSSTSCIYNEEDRLIVKMDGLNKATVYNYDRDGLLKSIVAPDDSITSFEYNSNKLIAAVNNRKDQGTKFFYDQDFNLSKILLTDGSTTEWFYDNWGRCIQIVNPLHKSQHFYYDELDRVTSIKKPDKNTVDLKYDSYDDIVMAEDNQRKVAFKYNPLGSLLAREENGTRINYSYDTENRLKSLRNQFDELYKFERNENGQIITETGFDGVLRKYERDRAGKVLRTERPGSQWSVHEYDLAGRLTRTEHNDGSWETFSYNRNGQLTEACNENSTVTILRDAAGRVIKETCGEHWVAGKYNETGKRIRIISSLGANINQEYTGRGNISEVSAGENENQIWKASYKYNSLGLETERILPGNIHTIREYDSVGRPVEQCVTVNRIETFRRRYTWDVNYRLTSMVNELTKGIVNYGHDEFGNLAWAKYENGDFDYRLPDAVGNLYTTEERKDKKYGAGGKLLESAAAIYEYDVEGNLLQKKEKNGSHWQYEWKGNGMLQKVIRPDGKEVKFEYDALGRRTSKTHNGHITRWLWNGNVPLHEWQYKEKEKPDAVVNEFGEIEQNKPEPTSNLISWIFDEGSFKPAAKIVDENSFSIITDYLGTPVEMYNAAGEKTWQAEYDIRGKIRNLKKGALTDCPFRYPGQYEDVETGLYYNRFRYYNADDGIYLSPDPIGIKGKNPTLYAYTQNPNILLDIFGLDTTLFRAVFGNEAADIANNNIIQNAAGGYETGKLFATSQEDAVAFGNLLQQWEDTEFKILTVSVPDDVNIHYFEADRMPAASIADEDLSKLKIISCK